MSSTIKTTSFITSTDAAATGHDANDESAITIGHEWTDTDPREIERLLEQVTGGNARIVTLVAGTEASAWPSRAGTTAWWEQQFLERGFRKSTRTPGMPTRLQRTGDGAVLRHPVIFERLDASVEARYPLAALKEERDLHMDMLREAGPRSDAHLARYRWASRFVPAGGIVVDAACGLGYGTAILTDTTGAARLIGIDESAYAIEYSRAAWGATRSRTEFHRGDARAVPAANGAVDVVTSIETLEHLEDARPLLEEFGRVLKPGGILIGSVPNLWVDASGKDPSPYHYQVFDRERLLAVTAPYFEPVELWQQNAAHDRDGQAILPIFQHVGFDGAGVDGKPEWLVFAARRR